MPTLFVTYALFASVFTVGKVVLMTLPPFFVTALRYVLAGLLMIFYLKARGQLVPVKGHFSMLLKVAIFNVFLTNGLEFWALQRLNSSKTALFYSFSPFYSMIFAYYALGESMSKNKILGLLIGFIGFLTLTFSDNTNANMLEEFSFAEIAANLAAIFSVFGWVYFKKLVYHNQFPAFQANAYSFLIGGILSWLVSLCIEPPVQEISPFFWEISYIIIVHSILCFSLYAKLLKRFTVTFLFFAGLLNPIFAACYGFIFLQEFVTSAFIFCIVFIGLGLYLFYLDEKVPAIN